MFRPSPRDFTSAPLSPPFRPTITQSLVCDLFIECNETFWGDPASHYWGYLRQNRTWHKCRECGGQMLDNWAADRHGQPFEDYLPEVHRDIQRVIRPLLETASAAEQRRAGSFIFVNGVMRMLEHDPRAIITRDELEMEPRPVREQMRAERDAAYRAGISEMLTRRTR